MVHECEFSLSSIHCLPTEKYVFYLGVNFIETLNKTKIISPHLSFFPVDIEQNIDIINQNKI